jgi:hypothetical protein
MHRYVLVTVASLSTFGLTACGLKLPDPCADTSPLQADPKVKEACEARGETGGEGGDYVCVTPFGYQDAYSLCVPNNYDNNFWWVPLTQESLVMSTVDHRECTPIVEYQGWASPNKAQQGPDYICMNVDSPHYSSPDGHAFALEENDAALGYSRSIPRYAWNDEAMTQATAIGYGQMSVFCPKGVLCVTAKDDCFCKCQSDADCASLTRNEAVCELGMCFYVDEPSAPDPLPPGPPAYGLEAWSDGLIVQSWTGNDHITMTPAFFTALLPGVFRDDQSFAADGRIEHCGPGSLCEHLELMVGDTAVTEVDAVDVLLAGGKIEVEIIHADGSDRTVTVSIDFDGDLTN